MASIRLAETRRDVARVRESPGSDSRASERDNRARGVHLDLALDVLRHRWRADVVWCLRSSPMRFNALLTALKPVSHKVLTDQLRALEYAGVISREPGPGGGRYVEYRLTTLGAGLPPILELLRAWGAARERTMHEHVGRSLQLHDDVMSSRASGA